MLQQISSSIVHLPEQTATLLQFNKFGAINLTFLTFKIIGYVVFVHCIDPQVKKLAPPGYRCILVGYDLYTKGHHYYHASSCCLLISSNVRIHKGEFYYPMTPSCATTIDTIVFLWPKVSTSISTLFLVSSYHGHIPPSVDLPSLPSTLDLENVDMTLGQSNATSPLHLPTPLDDFFHPSFPFASSSYSDTTFLYLCLPIITALFLLHLRCRSF